jgi:hypothetical protein
MSSLVSTLLEFSTVSTHLYRLLLFPENDAHYIICVAPSLSEAVGKLRLKVNKANLLFA